MDFSYVTQERATLSKMEMVQQEGARHVNRKLDFYLNSAQK
jgi:hypothetical protein